MSSEPSHIQSKIPVKLLGQAGCRLSFADITVYLDPYLSNAVQELENHDMHRLVPIPIQPGEITDADRVLISHDHIDHCDPHTLPLLAKASPDCIFYGPQSVLDLLESWGISQKRLMLATSQWHQLSQSVKMYVMPAAHPDLVIENNSFAAVGYLFQYQGRYLYFAGDTAITDEIIKSVSSFAPVDTMLLPVNEHNYFKAQNNILGNMSIREAFLFAEAMRARQVIPLHWDMFAENTVYPEEIKAVFNGMQPDFKLVINPNYL